MGPFQAFKRPKKCTPYAADIDDRMIGASNTINAILRKWNVEVRRIRPPRYPFVKHVRTADVDLNLWIATAEGETWYGNGVEQSEIRQLRKMIEPAERILEIGTHHGVFLQLLAQAAGVDGFVLGVEAAPYAAMVAQANISLNTIGSQRKVICAAATDRDNEHVGISSLQNVQLSDSDEQSAVVKVPTVTGDALDLEFGPFSMLKVDVEGHEYEVLKGCQKLLSRHPKLALELHVSILRDRGMKPEDVLALLDLERYSVLYLERPHYQDIKPFLKSVCESADVLNLFLLPR
jgi:FkbM family methyltransferase